VLDDAVATQDTVTQLIAVIRKVAREVPGAQEVVAQRCSAHDYTDPGKPQIAWDDSEARAVLIDALVRDALALVDVVSGWELDEQAARTVALLALIAGQDVEPAPGSDGTDGRWQIARKVAPDRVISVVDQRRGMRTRPSRASRTGSKRTWRLSPTPAWSPAAS